MIVMRLIDADRLSEAIYENVPAPYEDASWAKENCLAEIEAAPTIDAVPIVRCKNCKHFREYITVGTVCTKYVKSLGGREVGLRATKKDDFCSYGGKAKW